MDDIEMKINPMKLSGRNIGTEYGVYEFKLIDGEDGRVPSGTFFLKLIDFPIDIFETKTYYKNKIQQSRKDTWENHYHRHPFFANFKISKEKPVYLVLNPKNISLGRNSDEFKRIAFGTARGNRRGKWVGLGENKKPKSIKEETLNRGIKFFKWSKKSRDRKPFYLVISKLDINLQPQQIQINPLDQRSEEEKYIEKMFFTKNVSDADGHFIKQHAIVIFKIAEKLDIINKEDLLYLLVKEGINSYQYQTLFDSLAAGPNAPEWLETILDKQKNKTGLALNTIGKGLGSVHAAPKAGMALTLFADALTASGGGTHYGGEKTWNANPVVARDSVVDEKILEEEKYKKKQKGLFSSEIEKLKHTYSKGLFSSKPGDGLMALWKKLSVEEKKQIVLELEQMELKKEQRRRALDVPEQLDQNVSLRPDVENWRLISEKIDKEERKKRVKKTIRRMKEGKRGRVRPPLIKTRKKKERDIQGLRRYWGVGRYGGKSRKRKKKYTRKCSKIRLNKRMLCFRGKKKNLKRISKYTKRNKVKLTKCSKKRINKWK